MKNQNILYRFCLPVLGYLGSVLLSGPLLVHGQTMADAWQTVDIGQGFSGMTQIDENDSFYLSLYNSDETESEGWHYVFQPVKGDVTLLARLNRPVPQDGVAGLMIRTGTQEPASFALSGSFEDDRPSTLVVRAQEHGILSVLGHNPSDYPVWLMLTRVGNTVWAYSSSDGPNWDLVGTFETNWEGEELLVGMALSAGEDSKVVFDHVVFLTDDTLGYTGQISASPNAPVHISSSWQKKWFGRTGIDPWADPDNDGVENWREYARGSNPVRPYTPDQVNETGLRVFQR